MDSALSEIIMNKFFYSSEINVTGFVCEFHCCKESNSKDCEMKVVEGEEKKD
jgi:hypothetical protein